MAWFLFGLFVIVPVIEISLFIIIGERIGTLPTIILVIFTAILGSFLLQMQGLSTLEKAQAAIAKGRLPVDSVIDGVCLLVAGAFLLTPGFFTDGIGFLLFVPGLRRVLSKWAFERIKASKSVQFDYYHPSNRDEQRAPPAEDDSPVIEGEFAQKDVSETSGSGVPVTGKKNSPWKKV